MEYAQEHAVCRAAIHNTRIISIMRRRTGLVCAGVGAILSAEDRDYYLMPTKEEGEKEREREGARDREGNEEPPPS